MPTRPVAGVAAVVGADVAVIADAVEEDDIAEEVGAASVDEFPEQATPQNSATVVRLSVANVRVGTALFTV